MKKGVKCLEDLSGIFSFALLDERDPENPVFFIARDQIGVIPLYIGVDADDNLLCSSELKGLEGFATSYDCFLPGHYYYSVEADTYTAAHPTTSSSTSSFSSSSSAFLFFNPISSSSSSSSSPVVSLVNDGTIPLTRWYVRDWMDYANIHPNTVTGTDADAVVVAEQQKTLREALEESVRKQLMTDVPYGVLLSGGLDSSLVSSIAKKFAAMRVETDGQENAWWPTLHSFAVGLEGSPDLLAARKVANHIGSIHHELKYTIEEGLDAIADVIYHIESYDVTTVRASTPMFLLARYIKSWGIKMVLSGEGADEVFGGYLYFHKAPDARSLHEETLRKISKLYLYDCLRANKSLAAWGVEGRVPFLDKEFLDVAMRLDPALKLSNQGIEKRVLRSAFDLDVTPLPVVPAPSYSPPASSSPASTDAAAGAPSSSSSSSSSEASPSDAAARPPPPSTSPASSPTPPPPVRHHRPRSYLPKEVLWRQKEQFSDGVGYSWIGTLKTQADTRVSDEEMAAAAVKFPINPPKNKEEYLYRSIFSSFFPSDSAAKTVPSVASVACSTAEALAWDASFRGMNDPSGRSIKGVHVDSY